MPSHASHHRRAVRALFRRKVDNVHALDKRFSPTATFAEMTEVQPPDTVVFPPVGHPHQHQPTITSPILPPLLTPDPPTTTIPIVPITPITGPDTPITTPTITPTTTSTTLSSPAPATTTPPAVPTTPSSVVTPSSSIPLDLDTVTTLITASHISSAASSPSSTPSPSSGTNTGAVVGGIGAGVVAIAAIGFAVVFFVRRIRKRREDAIDFSPHDFRRSAVLLSDPPTHEDTVARGYNPPPPVSPMMQQRQQSSVSASTAYNEPYYGQERAAYGTYHQYQEQEQYPSQSAFMHSPLSSITSPHQGGAAASPYGPNPFTPSSLPSPYEQAAVATPQPAGMTRQLTADPHSPPTSLRSAQLPVNDYVDLNRSSVSPFQAAQYAEISRQLKSLPNSPVAEESSVTSPAELYATQQKDLPTVPPQSHSVGPSVSDRETITQARVNSTSPPVPAANAAEYAAPAAPVPPAPVAVAAASHSVSGSSAALPSPSFVTAATHTHSASPSHDTLSVQTSHLPTLSTDSFSHEPLEFPVPPSPALSYSSRYRVDSSPPTLPEITVQERSSVSSYIPKSPMIGTGYISGISEMSGTSGINNMGLQSLPGSARSDGKFIPTKSPLASSVVVATPIDAYTSVFAAEQEKALHDGSITTPSTAKPAMIHQQAAATLTPAAAAATSGPKAEGRRTTVYDFEDAYGGF